MHMAHLIDGSVERFELPGIMALNSLLIAPWAEVEWRRCAPIRWVNPTRKFY